MGDALAHQPLGVVIDLDGDRAGGDDLSAYDNVQCPVLPYLNLLVIDKTKAPFGSGALS
jgi:hypothetical protein